MILKKKEAKQILATLLQNGGEFAEIFMEKGSNRTLRWEQEKLDTVVQSSHAGTGFRVIIGEKTYFSSIDSIDFDFLLNEAHKLSNGIRGTEHPNTDHPQIENKSNPNLKKLKKNIIKKINTIILHPKDVPLKKKISKLEKADIAMRRYDSRIVQATVVFNESDKSVEIYNSLGVMEKEKRCQLSFACTAIAANIQGEIQTGTEVIGAAAGMEILNKESIQNCAEKAARLAILQLEAKPAPAGTFTVVLDSQAGGTMIHEAVGHGLEADFIEQNLSIYAGRMGEKVASPLITVIDDGTLPNKRGTEKMDDEGNPTKKVTLIKRGILVGYLHDYQTAKRMNLPITGNGRRQSFRHLPMPRMRNTFIKPGKHDPKKIISSVENGILVRKMGGGQVDIVNGNFVFHVLEGYMIRNGQIGEAIRGATLTGNGPKVMEMIDMVGTDLGFAIGTCGKNGQGAPVSDAQPTLRIPTIVVGGMVS